MDRHSNISNNLALNVIKYRYAIFQKPHLMDGECIAKLDVIGVKDEIYEKVIIIER